MSGPFGVPGQPGYGGPPANHPGMQQGPPAGVRNPAGPPMPSSHAMPAPGMMDPAGPPMGGHQGVGGSHMQPHPARQMAPMITGPPQRQVAPVSGPSASHPGMQQNPPAGVGNLAGPPMPSSHAMPAPGMVDPAGPLMGGHQGVGGIHVQPHPARPMAPMTTAPPQCQMAPMGGPPANHPGMQQNPQAGSWNPAGPPMPSSHAVPAPGMMGQAGPPMGGHQGVGGSHMQPHPARPIAPMTTAPPQRQVAPVGPPAGYLGTTNAPQSGPMPSAGPAPAQKQVTTDGMPHPLTVWEADVELHKGNFFTTNQLGIIPPLPGTPCDIVDQGNASSRFVRSTLYNVPCTKDVLHKSSIPLGLIVQPLAEVPEKERNIHIVNSGEAGPVRCRRCKGYVSPHVQFVDGGRTFICNLCSFSNEVPDYYQCQLDHHGKRLDYNERPELSCGSMEFMATTAYCKNEKWPEPPAYIFMIDVSYQSVKCGLLSMLSRMLQHILSELPKENGEQKTKVRIGLATFDSTVHFYNMEASLAQPQMMIVPEVTDVFAPFISGFFVDAEESSLLIEAVLQELPQLYGNTHDTSSCLGPAMKAGVEALKAAGCPGKVYVFSAARPKVDMPGGLKDREDRSLFRTEKEKNLYTPQSQFYPQLASECVQHGVCVEMFCCPSSTYVDVPTLSSLVAPTGGELHLYPNFNVQTDGERLLRDLTHSVSRETGFDAVMRIRCSSGLRATDFWGNFSMLNTTDVLLPAIDSDKAIGVEVKYDDKLGEEGCTAYYQVALLYTSVGGQRRLRIHNLAVLCTKQLSEVYRSADIDSVMNLFLKKAVKKLSDTSYKIIRGQLLEQSISLLAAYRKECSEPASGGRLILPEAMKLLPLYVGSLMKCEAICALSDTRIDEKAWMMQQITAMPVAASIRYLYPTILQVNKIDESGALPRPTRCYYEALQQEGAYLLENGATMVLWLGRHAHPEWLWNVFGVRSLSEINTEKFARLPVLDSRPSVYLRSVISKLQARRAHCMKVTVVLQGGQREGLFRRLLVEDGSGEGSPSYMDLLCHIHKEIRNMLK